MISRVSLLLLFILSAPMGSGTDNTPSSRRGAPEPGVSERYDALQEPELDPAVFGLALQGYQSLAYDPRVRNDSLLTIIDYSMPSSARRFFVIDLKRNRVVHRTLVAHGRNSGELYAERFSNRQQSYQSALGFYITGESYTGGQGYSLLLDGIEPGFNDQARRRAIVIHGAEYATAGYISRYGRLGRSLGCPSLPPAVAAQVIDLIRNGSVLFSYYPEPDYLMHSAILRLSWL